MIDPTLNNICATFDISCDEVKHHMESILFNGFSKQQRENKPMTEQDYIRGSKAAYRFMMLRCIKELSDDENVDAARLLAERSEAISALRSICADHGDNDWDDNLHLADILEKHLHKDLYDTSKRIEKMAAILKKSIEYIKQAHDEAEGRHDAPGEYYMDGGQWEIMGETDQLLKEINAVSND